MANLIYRFPTRRLTVIGVTGTDGKTTTVNMIYQILKNAGKKVSMVSTINSPGFHVTSPDPFTIQKFAKEALDNGDEYLVLEVTSHALDQYRFWRTKFDVGVITNITHEHLDYHKTFENYFQSKLKLLKNSKISVVNQNLNIKGITFGLNKGDFNQKEAKLKLKIRGDYNIENGLAGLAVAFVLNIDREIAQKTVESFSGLTGRMEEVKNSKGLRIFIDFAHTPNGLKNALAALQKKGRLIAIIGAEGSRDVGKRSMMGEIAQRKADIGNIHETLEKYNSVNIVLGETEQQPNIYSRSGIEEFLADGVMVFYNIKIHNIRQRALEIIKLRSSAHERKITPYNITSNGFEIYIDQELFREE